MKFLGFTVAILALLAVGTGYTCYHLSSVQDLHEAARKGDAMAWLRADFHLDDRQMADIKKLHEAYAPSCEEHCRLIQEAAQARDALRAANGSDPTAVEAAERTLQELRLRCETAISAHVRQVAEVMSPEDGRRYLALVLPRIAAFDHQAAPALDLKGRH
jgi:hypothetical protein